MLNVDANSIRSSEPIGFSDIENSGDLENVTTLDNIEEELDPGQELINNIFADPANARAEDFQLVSENYQQLYDNRLKELGVTDEGQLSSEDMNKIKNDPLLNLYQSKIDWADKWSNHVRTGGALEGSEFIKAFREVTSINEGFWLSVKLDDTNFTAEQRADAADVATKYGQITAFAQGKVEEVLQALARL